MTSNMMTIATHLSTDFLEAVKEAEMTDREAIENLMHDMNLAFTEFESRDRLLSTKAEQAIKTLNEIGDLRDVNWTTFTRRREAYVEAMAKLRDSKDTNVAIEGNSNVVKIA